MFFVHQMPSPAASVKENRAATVDKPSATATPYYKRTTMTTLTAIHAAQSPVARSGARQGNCMYLAASSTRLFGEKPVLNTIEGSDWRPPGG